MKHLHRVFAIAIIALATVGSALPVAAQTPESPGIDGTTRAQLAAIVPDANDMPVGYVFTGETFLSAEQIAAGDIDATAITDAGFVTQYVSVYQHADSNSQIRSYVSAWNDAAAAEAGFALIEDEARMYPDAGLADGEASVGEEPRETTTGTYTLPDGSAIGTADVTFRSDNLLIGVAVEKTDGSEADAEMAAGMAATIAERAETVQAGESPAGTDVNLPSRMLTFPDAGTTMQAGFLGASEVESVYGVQGSLLGNINTTWVETVALGEPVGATPVVTLGITQFATPEEAASAVEHASEIFAPLPGQESVEAELGGADAVAAYRYSQADGGEIDSYRLIASAGQEMIVVDIVGAPSEAQATDMANQIAVAQLECMGTGTCTSPDLASGLAE